MPGLQDLDPISARRWSHDPDVVSTELREGETVLLHLGKRRYFSLNRTGQVIWDAIGRGSSFGEIVSQLVARFSVSNDRAEKSVESLLSRLEAASLISARSAEKERS
ncbi:MAG: PqqD family protein [Deltaproteobacteria bacterium]|nr:PqqD family protein [Deltaproteobacteria bacterium]